MGSAGQFFFSLCWVLYLTAGVQQRSVLVWRGQDRLAHIPNAIEWESWLEDWVELSPLPSLESQILSTWCLQRCRRNSYITIWESQSKWFKRKEVEEKSSNCLPGNYLITSIIFFWLKKPHQENSTQTTVGCATKVLWPFLICDIY